jgi:hypothetical protein
VYQMSQATKARKAMRRIGNSQRLVQLEAVTLVSDKALFVGCVSVITPP